jgi:hypothetical protein
MKFSLLILALSIISFTGFSQMPGGGIQHGQNAGRQMPTGNLYGKLVDSKTNKPIEYAQYNYCKIVLIRQQKRKWMLSLQVCLPEPMANSDWRMCPLWES